MATKQPKLNMEHCLIWQANPGINPITGRKLKAGSPLYNKLDAQCKALLRSSPSEKTSSTSEKTSSPSEKTSCRVNWHPMTRDEASEYDQTLMIPCPCGKYKMLQMVHDEDGDYVCINCDSDVNLIYYCYHCKGSAETDS